MIERRGFDDTHAISHTPVAPEPPAPLAPTVTPGARRAGPGRDAARPERVREVPGGTALGIVLMLARRRGVRSIRQRRRQRDVRGGEIALPPGRVPVVTERARHADDVPADAADARLP